MIIGSMLAILVLGIVMMVISIFSKAALAITAGLAIGLFIWIAILFWPVFPVFSGVLVLLAVIRAFKTPASGLILALAIFVVLFIAWQILLVNSVNREVISSVDVINPKGTEGKALVVYHSKTNFTKKVSYAFANGLADKGWKVDITTASSKAPTDLSGFDLLVLGSPTYEWRPSQRIQDYLKMLGDLKDKPTVVIIVGEGYTVLSLPTMEKLVKQANGKLVKSLALWKLRPNIVNGEIKNPEEIARQAAQELKL